MILFSLGSKCQFPINPVPTGVNTFTKTRSVSMVDRHVVSTLFRFLTRLRHLSVPRRCPIFPGECLPCFPLSEQRQEGAE